MMSQSEFDVEIKDNITIVKIPETYVDNPLTEEQSELLLQFQEEFVCRYTDDDEEFVAIVKQGSASPPLVPSYRPFRNHRRDDRPRNEKRKWGDHRSYGNDQYSNYSHNNRQRYGCNDYRR